MQFGFSVTLGVLSCENLGMLLVISFALFYGCTLQGLPPVEIADGYEQALTQALTILPSLVVKKAENLRDVVEVKKFLKSAVMAKQYDNVDLITELVAKACGYFFLNNVQLMSKKLKISF